MYSRILIAFLACRLMTSALFQRDRPAIGADSRQIYTYNTAKIRCSTEESGNQANFFGEASGPGRKINRLSRTNMRIGERRHIRREPGDEDTGSHSGA